jgi:hypothetical protein
MLYLHHVIVQLIKNYYKRILFITVICIIGYTYYDPISQFSYNRYVQATPYISQAQALIVAFMNRINQSLAQATATPESQPAGTQQRDATETSIPKYIYTTVTSVANIRALPDKSSKQIGKAQLGDQLIVLSKNQEGTWYKIRFDNSVPHSGNINTSDGIGWIYAPLITQPTATVPVESIVVPSPLPTSVPKPRQYLAIQGTNARDVRPRINAPDEICFSIQIRNRDAQGWTFVLDGIPTPETFIQVEGALIADAAKCGVEPREYTIRIYDNQGNSVPGGTARVFGGYIYVADWVTR